MKPVAFDYAPAGSIDEALELLTREDAVPLAGGQSLVPMLNFRLAQPGLLVDLNPVAPLAGLDVPGGSLRIGALTRQAALLDSPVVSDGWPLLAAAVAHVGHAAIRSRGTVGGSVAHADPAAELPVALTALDARFHLRSRAAGRTLTAGELFRGALSTAIEPGELLVAIEVPPPPPGARMAFVEYARTHGDFAVAGAAVVLAPGKQAAIALLGAGPVPVRAAAAELALLEGAGPAEAARLAGAGVAGEWRRALVTALTERALDEAMG